MKISVKVRAGSGKNLVKKIDESHYKIWVTKPPEKGKANKAVVFILAKYFNLSPSKIMIMSGEASSNKVIKIMTNDK